MVGTLWHNETDSVKEAYCCAARQLKRRFMELHPGYRYCPRRPSEIQRRARPERVMARDRRNNGRGPSKLRRRAQLNTTIQMSSADDTVVPHSFPVHVHNAIVTQFPGVTAVEQGPFETVVTQRLPYHPRPITTVITNENLQAVVAARNMHDGQMSPTQATMIGSLSLNDGPSTVPSETQQLDFLENWEHPDTHIDDFFDFNASH